jgi:hypothetical protein
LAKGSVAWLLRCPRRALAAPDAGTTDDLVAGRIVDAAAKLATLVPQRPPTVEAALAYLDATGDAAVADHLADRGGVEALPADLAARIDRLATGWPAIDAGWWPRVEEPVRAVAAGGAVVLGGRLDLLLGGPPTSRPAIVVEVKAGRWHDSARADGHLYALLVALRDGVPPTAVVTVVADGTTQVEPVRPAVLSTAADRVVHALDVAGPIAAGEPAPAHPGPHCGHCPLRPACPEAATPPPTTPGPEPDRPPAATAPRPPARRPTGGPPPSPARPPAGPRAARTPDAVGAADRLRAAVAAEIGAALAGAPAPVADVYVGWSAAADAAGCPSRYRAGGARGWGFPGWSPATAAAAAGRAALDHHLHGGGPDTLGCPARLPAPLEVVRAWIREGAVAGAPGVGGWVGDLRAGGAGGGGAATLAATAALATRWLAGFVRVLGWPLPDGSALLGVTRQDGASGAPRWWPSKGSAVSVACGADARLGRVTGAGGHALVVHRPSSADDREVHGRAAFEAAAGALALRVAPAAVVVSAGDTGERARVPVDEDLLAAGGEMIVEVVRQRVAALTRGLDPADARPSSPCRWCPELDSCAPGAAWVAGGRRWRGGLPVLEAG